MSRRPSNMPRDSLMCEKGCEFEWHDEGREPGHSVARSSKQAEVRRKGNIRRRQGPPSTRPMHGCPRSVHGSPRREPCQRVCGRSRRGREVPCIGLTERHLHVRGLVRPAIIDVRMWDDGPKCTNRLIESGPSSESALIRVRYE
jgi:hypothetical protein